MIFGEPTSRGQEKDAAAYVDMANAMITAALQFGVQIWGAISVQIIILNTA